MSIEQQYIGDGLYVRLEASQLMILSTTRNSFGDQPHGQVEHWIALEPETFLGLLRFANQIGWGGVVQRAAREHRK